MAHKSRLQVAAYNRLRREYGLSDAAARDFCFRAATATSKGLTMGQVYDRIMDGSLRPPGVTPKDSPEADDLNQTS